MCNLVKVKFVDDTYQLKSCVMGSSISKHLVTNVKKELEYTEYKVLY